MRGLSFTFPGRHAHAASRALARRVVGGSVIVAMMGAGPPVAIGGLDTIALAQAVPSIQDAWYADSYVLKDGEAHDVDGLMLFTEREWSVTYFVADASGTPRRGAGEGGTYTLAGDRLVLTRLYLTISSEPIDSLPAIPLRYDTPANREPVVEDCTIELTRGRLVITFPSGNRMGFRRSGAS